MAPAKLESMFLFSSLTLTGEHLPSAVTLPAAEGFPPRQRDFIYNMFRNKSVWKANMPDKDRPRLSLELGERLGGGRTGVVYAARIVGTEPPIADGTIADSELCVKIGRPNRARTLAREAWMFDQLTEGWFQGVIAPRCYGFYTTSFSPDQLPIGLWASDPLEEDDPATDDRLPDDDPPNNQCADDPPGSREGSTWVDWKPNTDAPLLSVLVTARGGERYTDDDDDDEETKADILEILNDLTIAHILHNDFRPVNIVRAQQNTGVCRVHHHVHKWNLVDFAWSLVDEYGRDTPRMRAIHSLQTSAYRSLYFYTGKTLWDS